MVFRALALLALVVALSVVATIYFGQEVLIALGLILTQAKVIGKKLATIELPLVVAWLKSQLSAFFKVELLKKWLATTLGPLVLGKAIFRRFAGFLDKYKVAIRVRYRRLMCWYVGLSPIEKLLATLIILFSTLALSVTSIGLWLILFSVRLPLWIAATFAAGGRMLWASIEKTVFRAVAFLQLDWLWRLLKWCLPASILERKRRFDYRIARAVVRRRQMTLKQLEERKDSLPFRLALLLEYLRPERRSDKP